MCEFLSLEGAPAFYREFASCIKFCEEVDERLSVSSTNENDSQTTEMITVIRQSTKQEELEAVEEYHFVISKCLGTPVGLCKIL